MHSASTPTRCVHPEPDPQALGTDGLVHRSLNAMGCRFELILDPTGSPHDRYGAEAIADELTELIQDWHDRLSIFSPTSEVSRINEARVGKPVRVGQDLFELIRLCHQLCEETDGAFNIAAGTLMHAHGFRDTGVSQPVAVQLNLRDCYVLDTDSMSITRLDDRLSLDFGAIAKGFVLDLIADELRAYEIKHAFIHGGSSSILGFGSQVNAQPWRVRVSDAPAQINASLRSSSLGVSEIAGRRNERDEGHIMDPESGRPARSSVSRVACTHPSAAVADAYATALTVRPGLIDRLHEHGSSIAMFSDQPEQDRVLMRDRLGVFTNPIAN